MTTQYKFGKLAAAHDDRTLKAMDYLDLAALLPAVPATWSAVVPSHQWGMYGNDSLGDCTCAALAHARMCYSAFIGGVKAPTPASIIALYYRIGRMENPGQSKPDNGLVELDVLKYWQAHSVDAERIMAFASVDPHNHDHVKLAASLFNGLYIGFGISDPAQLFREYDAQTPWTPESGQVTEGHAVNIVAYDADTLTCVSWGREQRMAWAFWDQLVDEAWALFPQEYKTRCPAGMDIPQLQTDLAAIGAIQ